MSKSNFAQIKRWLHDDLHFGQYDIEIASADASFRSYYRITQGSLSYIVMYAPPQKEDCHSFIDISARLLAIGMHVPEVIAYDLDCGLLLLSDLGNCSYLQAMELETAKDTLYQNALDALLKMQQHTATSQLPHFNSALLTDEINLFFKWLLDTHLQLQMMQLPFKQDLYDLLIDNALSQPQIFVHRDYHSRNLMYCKDNNPGILDFQDAVIGPLSYDIVSLLKDCYVKLPRPYRQQLFQQYLQSLNKLGIMQSISGQQAQRWFDLMGVQRHMKACGIFARLWHRDKKAGYLKEIPRTLSYIMDLQNDYPELQDFCHFIAQHVLPRLDGAK